MNLPTEDQMKVWLRLKGWTIYHCEVGSTVILRKAKDGENGDKRIPFLSIPSAFRRLGGFDEWPAKKETV